MGEESSWDQTAAAVDGDLPQGEMPERALPPLHRASLRSRLPPVVDAGTEAPRVLAVSLVSSFAH